MNVAIGIATTYGLTIKSMGMVGQDVSLASDLQTWMWEIQNGTDRTGETGHRLGQFRNTMVRDLVTKLR
jgi:hypothetical protein